MHVSWDSFALPLNIQHSGTGILTCFPIADNLKNHYTQLTCCLGPTNSRPISVIVKPLSTSALKNLIWVIATSTKICTEHSFTQTHVKSFDAYAHALLHVLSSNETTVLYRLYAAAPSIFRASPFGRWVVTHSLADFNFHDHRPAVFMNQHLLWYLMSI